MGVAIWATVWFDSAMDATNGRKQVSKQTAINHLCRLYESAKRFPIDSDMYCEIMRQIEILRAKIGTVQS